MIFLDTNICIYFLKGLFPEIRDHLLAQPPNRIKISVIVHAELLYGIEKSNRREETLAKLQQFLSPFEIVPYSETDSQVYADIRAACERKGELVGPNDLLIASQVIAHGGQLATRNIREFSRIEGLKMLHW